MSVLEEYRSNAEKRELYRRQLDGWRRQRTQEVALAEEKRLKEEALLREQQALSEKQQAVAREQQALEEAARLREWLKRLGVDPSRA